MMDLSSARSLSAVNHVEEAMTVPKISRDSAELEDVGVLCDQFGELDDYSVDFLTFREDLDATPLLKGLPDDQCQCPHWG